VNKELANNLYQSLKLSEGDITEVIAIFEEMLDTVKSDNEAWHKKDREYEAYCAGRNDLLKAIKDKLEDKDG